MSSQGPAQAITSTCAEVLTIEEIARELRCSKSQISNILNGKILGLPPLPHLRVGRRKIVRRVSLQRWMELVEGGELVQ